MLYDVNFYTFIVPQNGPDGAENTDNPQSKGFHYFFEIKQQISTISTVKGSIDRHISTFRADLLQCMAQPVSRLCLGAHDASCAHVRRRNLRDFAIEILKFAAILREILRDFGSQRAR